MKITVTLTPEEKEIFKLEWEMVGPRVEVDKTYSYKEGDKVIITKQTDSLKRGDVVTLVEWDDLFEGWFVKKPELDILICTNNFKPLK